VLEVSAGAMNELLDAHEFTRRMPGCASCRSATGECALDVPTAVKARTGRADIVAAAGVCLHAADVACMATGHSVTSHPSKETGICS